MLAKGRRLCAILFGLLLFGAAPRPVVKQIDSQVVLMRYFTRIATVAQPKAVIFQYSVSQSGPNSIEQVHRIYRAAGKQRDETLAVDGLALKPAQIRFSHYHDRYAISALAPRSGSYTLLLLRAHRVSRHFEYTYRALPPGRPAGFTVTTLTIDGSSYLPSAITFTTTNGTVNGKGSVHYARAGRFWMPMLANVVARIAGKPARERIAWSQYRFPSSMPPSTFH
ncbi:MAG: hypothetical protein M3Y21_00755 [Candidatus Eremiobacteraeota bacterium]|nr:hypothetical protein [Candidatus Eremiobacteraeota bacterium]